MSNVFPAKSAMDLWLNGHNGREARDGDPETRGKLKSAFLAGFYHGRKVTGPATNAMLALAKEIIEDYGDQKVQLDILKTFVKELEPSGLTLEEDLEN